MLPKNAKKAGRDAGYDHSWPDDGYGLPRGIFRTHPGGGNANFEEDCRLEYPFGLNGAVVRHGLRLLMFFLAPIQRGQFGVLGEIAVIDLTLLELHLCGFCWGHLLAVGCRFFTLWLQVRVCIIF